VLSQEESSGAWDGVKQLIIERGGEITQEEQWGMRRLAYPIRKAGQTFLEGNYLLTRFSMDTVVPRELDSHLTLAENVLRFLVVRSEAPKIVAPPPEPTVMAEVEEAEAEEPVVAEVEEAEAGEPVVTETDEADDEESLKLQTGDSEPAETAASEGEKPRE
jgi:small subunit ribosomal protein S6